MFFTVYVSTQSHWKWYNPNGGRRNLSTGNVLGIVLRGWPISFMKFNSIFSSSFAYFGLMVFLSFSRVFSPYFLPSQSSTVCQWTWRMTRKWYVREGRRQLRWRAIRSHFTFNLLRLAAYIYISLHFRYFTSQNHTREAINSYSTCEICKINNIPPHISQSVQWDGFRLCKQVIKVRFPGGPGECSCF
jgi:hypothetical protein